MSSSDGRDDSWNKYWEHGFLTSCRNAFVGNYEGAIRDLWLAFFGALAPSDRVLDICTGNGAIAMITNQVSRDRGLHLEIHGIDAAAIRPLETVQSDRELLEGIHFHGLTPAESTGFEDRYFQASAGQYALEYTDVRACVEEMARISAPEARVQFVLHPDRSIVMETSREEIRNARLLFDDSAIFASAGELIRIVGSAQTPQARQALKNDPAAEAARNALNESASKVTEAAEASPHPQLLHMALQNVAEAYRKCGAEGPDVALSLLEDCRQRILANAERLEDLMSAGRTAEQIETIHGCFEHAGFDMEPPSLIHHERGPLMGWVLSGQRSLSS